MSDPSLGAISGGVPPLVPVMPPAPRFHLPARQGVFDGDFILAAMARISGMFILVMLAALLVVLFMAARLSMHEFGWHFFVSSDWRPNELVHPQRDAHGKVMFDSDGEMLTVTEPPSFGALPVIYGTAVSSAMSLFFAVPLSLGAAIFLVRIAPTKIVPAVSFLVEFLAAIPSIAYGIWGLFVLAPFLQTHIEPFLMEVLRHIPGTKFMLVDHVKLASGVVERAIAPSGRDMLCGSMVLAVMITPIITAISRDVLRQVPRAQIEGAVALGATWWESCKEMLKYSRSGLFGAIMLGLARAAGETMAIAMVIGNNPQIVPSPFAAAQSMSSLLANQFSEASLDIHRAALCEVALILLLMSLLFNMIARYLVVGGKDSRGARGA